MTNYNKIRGSRLFNRGLFFLLLIIFSVTSLSATTGDDLSGRIIIDGFSNDFEDNERLFIKEPLAESQELDDDSWWGEYNDVKQIDLTWDLTNLYVAIDACSWDNNVIYYLDIYPSYGIHDMLDLNTWMRAFTFYGTNPDFFLATWDTNDNPQFWKMREGSSLQADEISIEDYSTYNTGNLGRAMEAAIPWEVIYYDSTHSMKNFPELKMLAVITTGSDNLGGPDVIPNNLGGMPSDGISTAVLDNYVSIVVDSTGDGSPDIGISPKERVHFYKTPPFEEIPLNVNKVEFPDGKVFAPDQGETLSFKIDPNRVTAFNVEIYDVRGEYVGKAQIIDETTQEWEWDGKNQHGNTVPFGIYVLRVVSDSKEVSHNEAISVIK